MAGLAGLAKRGTWWLLDYLYAGRRQLRSLLPGRIPESFRDGTSPPVVILPGIYESWRFMQPLVAAVNEAGHPVHVMTVLQQNRRPVAASAELIADYLEKEDLRNVVIVAHSKGGLIGKHLMLDPRTADRVQSMVAICTPFSGSRYARLMVLPSLRAFSPRNATTLRLAAELGANERITSIYGTFDPHIPEGSELPGARNIRLPVAGHFRILGEPDTVAAVLEHLPA
jgi:pimeloyl-ACP methyl ester carboxylesterase